ncbi:hypothetical protein COX85_01530 [Candidatus Micrarchaeota archaeon CG_4_10_14_0_2_um_filter_55_9]|nr:MAG: hypothetical protein AUJ15_02305 [Candidatus Micrarchaeota archaeon CG1_02_55_41]PIO02669.1 MAG: hypothetical protein COT57_02795 [Candidatus Micrarchaeota archaeon CG09_land_8_20_14_0_10_55_25]PIZ91882.1 MAG: hypothetical protein COX85_01530 [Candidatus Micrarchaeota archaeon CG_4_10_14_0_2_um_filter_55_9]PJD01217.1 MAG: hypothetical protein COU38_02050 [Candidatus Micrarchaeota archaeon CG10_big_fil_rev_8_21_14_0_10_54_18]
MRRAQSSIEALIVVAALIAFFAALAPYYSRISAFSTAASLAVREQAFCDVLASKARDARLLPGSSFSFNLSAPVNATIYFDGELHCNFSRGNNFSRDVGPFSVQPARGKEFGVFIDSQRILLVPADD